MCPCLERCPLQFLLNTFHYTQFLQMPQVSLAKVVAIKNTQGGREGLILFFLRFFILSIYAENSLFLTMSADCFFSIFSHILKMKKTEERFRWIFFVTLAKINRTHLEQYILNM